VRTIIGLTPTPTLMNTTGQGSALATRKSPAVKEVIGLDRDKKFEVRDEVIAHTRRAWCHAGQGSPLRKSGNAD